MRLFVAIKLNDDIKDVLANIQDSWMFSGVKGNYTLTDNMHLTLAFIGEYEQPYDVLDVIEGIEFEPFDISLEGIGAFDSLWWAGLSDSDELKEPVIKLRRALSDKGIPFDSKSFTPHITLVRKAESPSGSIPAIKIPSGISMTVDHISLFRSDRGKNGMVYTEIN